MKKHIFLLISTFFLFVGFFACLYLNRGSVNADLPISFQIEGKETIDCWEKDNHLYLFLPSYAKTENVTACLNSKDSLFLGGSNYLMAIPLIG